VLHETLEEDHVRRFVENLARMDPPTADARAANLPRLRALAALGIRYFSTKLYEVVFPLNRGVAPAASHFAALTSRFPTLVEADLLRRDPTWPWGPVLDTTLADLEAYRSGARSGWIKHRANRDLARADRRDPRPVRELVHCRLRRDRTRRQRATACPRQPRRCAGPQPGRARIVTTKNLTSRRPRYLVALPGAARFEVIEVASPDGRHSG